MCFPASGICVVTACTKSSASRTTAQSPVRGSGGVVTTTFPSSRSVTAPTAMATRVTNRAKRSRRSPSEASIRCAPFTENPECLHESRTSCVSS